MEWTERQREIIVRSIELIAKNGIQDFTTKKLAKLMNLSEAAIYRHFEGKNDIMANIIDYLERESMAILLQSNQEVISSLEKLKHFVMSRFRLFSEQPDLAYIMFNDSIFQNDEALSSKMLTLMQKHQKFLYDSVMQAKSEGFITHNIDNDVLFLILIGPVRLLIHQWIISRYTFDLMAKATHLWNELEKILKESKNKCTDHQE